MTLRLATESDIPLIADMARRIWLDYYPAIVSVEQVEYMLERFYSATALSEQMHDGQAFYLPEATKLGVAGYLSVSETEPGSFFMHKFYIDNGLRGRGIGQEALRLLGQALPEMNELRLNVNRKNFQSINFYFKTGFVIESCMDIPIGNGYEMNDFRMVLHLKRSAL